MINSESEQGANNRPTPRTDQTNSSDAGSAPAPSISLPKGGGAIRSIGEKFSANPVTGTGSLSVPIFTTPGRSDFYPKLSLSYDSGAGNGPFGIGWNLSVPSITRKTDKGLPRYQDATDSDTFILSEAEDLVPFYIHTGDSWVRQVDKNRSENGIAYRVWSYRPRIEGLFARIERWENKQTGETHWRSVSKENVTSIYGKSLSSRIADPGDDSRVFKWLLDESYDDRGNAILYAYKQENPENIDPSLPQEKNRLADGAGFAIRYLKRIQYGNTTPYQRADWLFEMVFDYGEHDLVNPTVDEAGTWSARLDPFSSFRACFEVRTYRLCRRILVFHRFAELGNAPCLVRSTDLHYKDNSIATYLTSIIQTGYTRLAGPEKGYAKRSLPPLEISYSEPVLDEEIHFIDADSLENLPVGLDGTNYQWMDLDSEGVSGILTEQADAWFYKRNLGDARFAPAELVAAKPSSSNLQSGQQHIMDLAGDGQKYLVQFSVPPKGYYEHMEDGQWGPFTPFVSSPNIAWNDPNLKFIDLDGDGLSDVLFSEQEVFTWYRSLGRDGFAPAESFFKPFDEEKGPALVFADATQSIYLADMTGDGLTDIVRICNGEVSYWPNRGYGRFGAKVTMDAAPSFDFPDYFEQKRIRLADIDGSGTTDIIYLGRDVIRFWFNQSGNSWSVPYQLTNFPATDNLSSVTVVDLLGTGTAYIVWSSPLPGDAGQPMRYIDLMGGQKPHLLQAVDNNMGKITRVHYAASTKFYLEDRAAGNPWVTKLPFPVQVVEQVDNHDGVSGARLVTQYRYHHGYYDAPEREFRGFGLVEQWDTESFAQFKSAAASVRAARTLAADLYVPPAYTKTWFHTGAYLDRQNISQHFAREYYSGDPKAALLPDTTIPLGLTAQEEREACRALKGRILRQEIYAQDQSSRSADPYTVSEHTYSIRMIQPVLDNPHGVFYAYECEALDYHYERHPDDPRMAHSMTLEVDAYGNVTKSAAIGYSRRVLLYPEQNRTLITYKEAAFINVTDVPDFYRIGVPCERKNYEITGVQSQGDALLAAPLMLASIQKAEEIPYEEEPAANSVQKRLIEQTRTLYYNYDLSGPLPLRQVDSHALPYKSYSLAFTPGLLTQVFGNRAGDALLAGEGKYMKGKQLKDLGLFGAEDQDTLWWAPSAQSVPDSKLFYLPVQIIDAMGNASAIEYDTHALLLKQTTDPLGNTIVAENDYRVMQPGQVTDPNGNRSQVAFDTLGLVVGTAVMGKEGENVGDSLDGFVTDLDDATMLAHLQDPLNDPQAILGKATSRIVYDLWGYYRSKQILPNGEEQGQPVAVYTLAREKHNADLAVGEQTRVQHRFTYLDGFAREIQTKIQAEPGPVDGAPVAHRWVGTGWKIFNNKGKPVKQFEPFFSTTPSFEFAQQRGVSSTLFYDPLERLVATLHPNHTYEKIVFDVWQQTSWDVNDTVTQNDPKADPDVGTFFQTLKETEYLPTWYKSRIDGQLGDAEKEAATKAAAHANTPTILHLDVLGRTFLTITDNGSAGKYQTHLELDIEGNQRVVTDARGNEAMVNTFGLLRLRLYFRSIDAGERWTLNNVASHPLREWNSRGFQMRYLYDALQRPTHLFVQEGGNAELLAERSVYGEALLSKAADSNLRTRVYQRYDGAGVATNEQYDFKGNLLRGSQQLAQTYQRQVDWIVLANLTDPRSIIDAAKSSLEVETFTTTTTYDALNRVTSMSTPDKSVILPTYNVANLLEKLDVRLRGAIDATPFVKNLDYNEKGQRELIEYNNNVSTTYIYDPLTFRMTNLKTVRASDNTNLQNLSYTYDPVGNITEIQDDAQQTTFFKNDVVSPGTQYVYNALYQLTQAKGREHIGQNPPPPSPWSPEYDYNDAGRINLPHPNDGKAMQSFTENYQYDEVGNINAVQHEVGGNAVWTRRYDYPADSNRLRSTSFPGDSDKVPLPTRYTYDAHGNMTQLPHLQKMQWNFKDQLQQIDVDGKGTTVAYYVYDANGQRVRKVVQSGALIKERLYVGGWEIYRERNGGGVRLERETLHVMDDKRRITLVETKTNDVAAPANTLPSTLIRYQLDNHLGSAILELDDAGAIISYEEYYPYGSTSYQAGRNEVEVSLKRYRYTGKERDEETGLYYYGARYYAPWLGRWESCDPVGMVDGTNLYTFVSNNPISTVDITGKQAGPSNQDEPWWRFTDVPMAYDPGAFNHPLIKPTIKNDTGYAALNYPVNFVLGISNLVSFPLNAAADTLALPKDIARSLGASEEFLAGMDFALMMVAPQLQAATELKTLISPMFAEETVTLYRGTSIGKELETIEETNTIMSEAGRRAYWETTGSLEEGMINTAKRAEGIEKAKTASEIAHAEQVQRFGSLSEFVKAHAGKGTEIGGQKTLISFTTDPQRALYFANYGGKPGRVFSVTIPKSQAIFQTYSEGSEAEVLVPHISRGVNDVTDMIQELIKK